MADTKIKCLADREDFSEGTEYPVLAFGDAHCVLRNDEGKIVALGYATVNDSEAWEFPSEKKDNTKAKAAAEPTGDTK